jgi:hypothetical protein
VVQGCASDFPILRDFCLRDVGDLLSISFRFGKYLVKAAGRLKPQRDPESDSTCKKAHHLGNRVMRLIGSAAGH